MEIQMGTRLDDLKDQVSDLRGGAVGRHTNVCRSFSARRTRSGRPRARLYKRPWGSRAPLTRIIYIWLRLGSVSSDPMTPLGTLAEPPPLWGENLGAAANPGVLPCIALLRRPWLQRLEPRGRPPFKLSGSGDACLVGERAARLAFGGVPERRPSMTALSATDAMTFVELRNLPADPFCRLA